LSPVVSIYKNRKFRQVLPELSFYEQDDQMVTNWMNAYNGSIYDNAFFCLTKGCPAPEDAGQLASFTVLMML